MSNQDRPASEDSLKEEHQKKIKDSPEEKRQKRIEEEVKEKEELLDDIEDVAIIKRIAKKEIRSQVRRRLLEEEEKVDYKTKYQAANRDKDTLKTSINIQNAKLNLRPRIEKLERDVIPDFILFSTNFPENVNIETFADAMTLAYRSSSEYINHDKTPSQILLSAAEWEVLFKDLNIFDQEVKESVILCVDDSIYKPRKRKFTKPNNVFDFLVYVNCLSITNDRGQNEIQGEIKRISKRAILLDAGNEILDENFLFIYDSRTSTEVEVFFLINKVTYNDMKSIKEELLKMKGSGRIVWYWKVSPF